MIETETFQSLKLLFEDEFDDFLTSFIDDTKSNIEKIVSGEDLSINQRLGHTVKSSLATIGAVNAAKLAESIEKNNVTTSQNETAKELQEIFAIIAVELTEI